MSLLVKKIVAIATATIITLIALNPVKAQNFDEEEVEQDLFVAVARPFGGNKYDLLIIEQIPGKQDCWSESGSNPVVIDPLLLNFDFTGICRRSTDSNGYSIRIDGKDYGLDYMLRIVKKDGELVLLGTNRLDRKQPDIEIGRTNGFAEGLLKINLNPGWRFSKRSYQGKTLGHIYFSSSESVINNPENPEPEPLESQPKPEEKPPNQ